MTETIATLDAVGAVAAGSAIGWLIGDKLGLPRDLPGITYAGGLAGGIAALAWTASTGAAAAALGGALLGLTGNMVMKRRLSGRSR